MVLWILPLDSQTSFSKIFHSLWSSFILSKILPSNSRILTSLANNFSSSLLQLFLLLSNLICNNTQFQFYLPTNNFSSSPFWTNSSSSRFFSPTGWISMGLILDKMDYDMSSLCKSTFQMLSLAWLFLIVRILCRFDVSGIKFYWFSYACRLLRLNLMWI